MAHMERVVVAVVNLFLLLFKLWHLFNLKNFLVTANTEQPIIAHLLALNECLLLIKYLVKYVALVKFYLLFCSNFSCKPSFACFV